MLDKLDDRLKKEIVALLADLLQKAMEEIDKGETTQNEWDSSTVSSPESTPVEPPEPLAPDVPAAEAAPWTEQLPFTFQPVEAEQEPPEPPGQQSVDPGPSVQTDQFQHPPAPEPPAQAPETDDVQQARNFHSPIEPTGPPPEEALPESDPVLGPEVHSIRTPELPASSVETPPPPEEIVLVDVFPTIPVSWTPEPPPETSPPSVEPTEVSTPELPEIQETPEAARHPVERTLEGGTPEIVSSSPPPPPPPPAIEYIEREYDDRRSRWEPEMEDIAGSADRADRMVCELMKTLDRLLDRLSENILSNQRRIETIESRHMRDECR